MTQREAARRLGINQQAFSALERNPGSVGTERVLKLLNVLGVEVVVRTKMESPRAVPTSPGGPPWQHYKCLPIAVPTQLWCIEDRVGDGCKRIKPICHGSHTSHRRTIATLELSLAGKIEGQTGGNMMEMNKNEIMIGHVIYVFASAALARGFEACLNTGTVSSCKMNYPPIAIYPPANLISDEVESKAATQLD